MPQRWQLLVVMCCALLVLGACATSGDPAPSPTQSATTTPTLDRSSPPSPAPRCTVSGEPRLSETDRACVREAIDAGVDYLSTQLREVDPNYLAFFDHLYRVWGVEQFSYARRLGETTPGVVDADNLEGRLWDASLVPSAATLDRVDDPEREHFPLERALGAVLSCDLTPLDDRANADLATLLEEGGYSATHVLLWTQWARDLDCDLEIDTDEVSAVVARELATADRVHDLALEQATFLQYSGDSHLVPADWPARVVAEQLPNGAWSGGRGGRDWHATLLAVWSLLHAVDPPAQLSSILP